MVSPATKRTRLEPGGAATASTSTWRWYSASLIDSACDGDGDVNTHDGSASIRERAELHRLATAVFPIDALTPAWKDGTNHAINQRHKRRFCRTSQRQGPHRTEVSNRMRTACTIQEVEEMLPYLDRPGCFVIIKGISGRKCICLFQPLDTG